MSTKNLSLPSGFINYAKLYVHINWGIAEAVSLVGDLYEFVKIKISRLE